MSRQRLRRRGNGAEYVGRRWAAFVHPTADGLWRWAVEDRRRQHPVRKGLAVTKQRAIERAEALIK